MLESFLIIWLMTHDEQARNTRIGEAILFSHRYLVRYWAWLFLVESILAGVTAAILIYYSFAAASDLSYENEMTAIRRENAVLRQDLDQALSILHHERLLHFGIASDDVRMNSKLTPVPSAVDSNVSQKEAETVADSDDDVH